MDKKRAIEIALLYIPTMLGDEADLGITYRDLEEVPNVLKEMLNSYEQTRADAIDEFCHWYFDMKNDAQINAVDELIKRFNEQLKEQSR